MPANPSRNDDGFVIAHDDPSLSNNGYLIRHINPEFHTHFDENLGYMRLGSNAFSHTSGDPDYGLSCDIGQLLEEAGLPENSMVPTGFGAVRLQVQSVRDMGLKVGSDPEPTNPYHGQIWGAKSSFKSKIHRTVIDWIVPLANVHIR